MNSVNSRSLVRFVVSGILYVMVCEFVYHVANKKSLVAFLFTPVAYIGFALIFYWLHTRVRMWFANRVLAHLVYLVVCSFLVIVLLEWIIMGLSPWGGKDAFQLGMVLIHGGWIFVAHIYDDTRNGVHKLRKYFVLSMLLTLLVAFVGVIMVPAEYKRIWLILVPIFGYATLWPVFIVYLVNDWRGKYGRLV